MSRYLTELAEGVAGEPREGGAQVEVVALEQCLTQGLLSLGLW
jgi:hypothetical protein